MQAWARFLVVFLAIGIVAILAIAGLIVWANPYRNIPFASMDRPIMDLNQRYVYPAVARDVRFDSAVFGTSSIRLLKPEELEAELGGKFAELAMNNASAYEIYRMMRLFVEIRQAEVRPISTMIVGLDVRFCAVEEQYERFTRTAFPPWMYDHNAWNDLLYLFNAKSLKISRNILAYQLGLRNWVAYRTDGYGNFLPPAEEYDIERARTHLYGSAEPKPIVPEEPAYQVTQAEKANWTYASHALWGDLLQLIPQDTRLLMVFVPYHAYSQARPGSIAAAQWQECKTRFVTMAKRRPNTMVLDFMLPTSITLRDENYWDPLHYTVETASLLSRYIGEAVRSGRQGVDYAILHDGLQREMTLKPRE